MRPNLSVIVPVHNEEANIDVFCGRILPVLSALPLPEWEIVFVNNGSTDGTLDKILALRKADQRVKVITLSRNFGFQVPVVAGLSTRDSDLYALIDVDCEDPPEVLAQFHQEIQRGAHIAYGIRSQRDEPGWMTWCRSMFYRINRRIADAPVVLWMAEFAMITRTVRDAVVANRSMFPFVRSEIGSVGLKTVGVPYVRARRAHGISHQSLIGMVRFAMRGFLASSTLPLRAAGYVSALWAVVYLALVLGFRLRLSQAAQVAVLFAFAYLLLMIPLISVYVARAYSNTVGRPLFIIDPEHTSV